MTRRRVEVVLISLFLGLLTAHAVWREFDHDEFEHVHSAWYVSQGCVPYKEFFQHHHPLLWMAIVPIISTLGERLEVLLTARIMMLAMAAGILALTNMLARELRVPGPGRRLALLLLISQVVFFAKSIEVRPDVPALLLGLLGVTFWLRGVTRRRYGYLVGAGLAVGASFVVLQKTAWFVIAATIVLTVGRRRLRVSGRELALAAASAVMPVAGLLLWVLAYGLWTSYMLSNWYANAGTSRVLDVTAVRDSLLLNPVFWAAATIAAIRWGRRRHGHLWLSAVIWLAGLLLCLQGFDKRPNSQDLLWPQTLLAIPSGYWLSCVLRSPRTLPVVKALAVPLVVAAALVTALQLGSRMNTWQLRRAAYVLDHTTPSDDVYDGDATFNLFRRDMDFYWFARQPGSVADTHAALAGWPAPREHFVERLLAARPAIAGSFLVDWRDPRLGQVFAPTLVAGLRARIGPPAAALPGPSGPSGPPGRLRGGDCWR